MRFFSKAKKYAGWMAITLHPDGVCAAHMKRSPQGKYALELAAFFQAQEIADTIALEKLAKELHVDRYHCTTLLTPGEYNLLLVDAPNVQPQELKMAIRWRLKDLVDYSVDDATVDVLEVPNDKNSAARASSMYAVVARNQVIEQRQSLFDNVKIPVSVIDIPDIAQRNISSLLEPEGRGVAMLSFEMDGGLLTVTFGGELYLSRRIDVTFPQLSQAEAGQKQVYYDRITLELQRSLDHFERQYHFITISKLVLSPLEEEVSAGLRDYLAENLYVPVEILNLDGIVDLSKVPELKMPHAQRRYLMAIGAAMRHEEKTL